MIEEVEIPEATEEFMEYIKRPVVLNAKRAKELISDLEESIIELRAKIKPDSRLANNMIYNQIENRKAQIKHANTFL